MKLWARTGNQLYPVLCDVLLLHHGIPISLQLPFIIETLTAGAASGDAEEREGGRRHEDKALSHLAHPPYVVRRNSRAVHSWLQLISCGVFAGSDRPAQHAI